ncbi:UNVERIFIED_ORG: hypothetical protein J2S79_002730 [Pantoea agglomerans]|jgi:hypothetical protein|nr:hypothetical protein L371_02640 [Enterobacter sp. MGH 25]EUM39943.1 hypothetical protein L383_03790 [Enterobacter sp. MGH 37]KDF48256.1 hypothetical protein AE42_00244 [Enterobacter kobei]CAE7574183.1 hypothetical protein AI2762V1_0012 [Enterobacter cloacae]CAH3444776.1 hypothetical protein AI2762V1_0012 [Enterobacter cloacae]
MRRTGVTRYGGMKTVPSPSGKCASYFALVRRWLRFLTPVTYFCMLPGMRKLAAFPQHELFSAFWLRF